MNLFKKLSIVVAVVAASMGFSAGAQDMPYDHMHLIATDPEAAVKWYAKYMDGEDVGRADRLRFDSTWFIFFKRDAGFEGSEGTSVDHIGFSFTDLEAKMAEYKEAGIKVLAEIREIPGKFKFAFVEDPWGTKIEVMQDLETLGFHHIHLKGPEPAKILDWYVDAFGGERTKYKGMLDAVLYGKVWLLAQGAREAMAPTKGRAIDHLGWGVHDMEADAKVLKDKGVPFTMEPRKFNPEIAIAIAFVEAPGGVRIELVQRP